MHSRLQQLGASEWLASGIVAGGVFGAATLLRIRPGSGSLFAIAPASPHYLEALISLLITFVGFVIIAIVFVYEQQRRAWRIAFRIRDGERGVVVRGAALSVALVLLSIWSGLVALSRISTGEVQLESAWPVLVTAVTGFGGTAGAIATVVMGVRLLSSRRLAARILSAPERISSRDELDEPLRPSDHLMELALAEHRAEDDEEFRARVGSLRRYGAAASTGAEAQDAARALIDVAMLVLGRRDRARAAVLAAQQVLGNTALSGRDQLLRKTLTLLDRNLSHEHPSGSLLGETIELARLIHPEPSRREELYSRAVEGTLLRSSPADLWENAIRTLLPGEAVRDHRAEQALVAALAAATDPGGPALAAGGSTARLAATRVMKVLPHLNLPVEGLPDGLDHATIQRLHVHLLCLWATEGSARSIPTGDAADLVHGMAARARHLGGYEWANPLPAGHRSSAIMLSEVLRVVQDPKVIATLDRGGLVKQAVRNQMYRTGRLLDGDPEMMTEVVEFVLDYFDDIVSKRRAAVAIRVMLWANEPLRGVTAIPSFFVLRDMARALNRSTSDASTPKFGSLDLYFRHGSRPAAGYFSPGLDDCSARARELLQDTTSILQGSSWRPTDGPLDDSEELRAEDRGADAAAPKADPVAVFGRFALLLATALAVHLDDQDGINVFARVARTVSELPLTSLGERSAATVGQLLMDALALSTLLFDLVRSKDESDDETPTTRRFDLGRTMTAVAGLDLLSRVCEMDLAGTGGSQAEASETLDELRGAIAVIVGVLATSAGEVIIGQIAGNSPKSRPWVPWVSFPDWAWGSAVTVLSSSTDVALPDGATQVMIAEITDEGPGVWHRTSGFRQFVECLIEHDGLSDLVQTTLLAMLADVEAAQASVTDAIALLDRARQTNHIQIELRRMFIEYASSQEPPRGAGLDAARMFAQDRDPRRVFATVETGMRWMRSANRRLTLADCTRRFAAVHDALVPAALAEQAMRGHTLNLRKHLHVGARRLERIARGCRKQIRRMEQGESSRGLVPGLDPIPHEARIIGLHIAHIAIATAMRSKDHLALAHESLEAASALLEEVPPSLGGKIRRSLDAARSAR